MLNRNSKRRCQNERDSTRTVHERVSRGSGEDGVGWRHIITGSSARRLSLPPSMSGNRVRAHKADKLGDTGKTQRPLTDIEMEPARAKKAPVEAGMERNLLKKAAAYFVRRSRRPVRGDIGYRGRPLYL